MLIVTVTVEVLAQEQYIGCYSTAFVDLNEECTAKTATGEISGPVMI